MRSLFCTRGSTSNPARRTCNAMSSGMPRPRLLKKSICVFTAMMRGQPGSDEPDVAGFELVAQDGQVSRDGRTIVDDEVHAVGVDLMRRRHGGKKRIAERGDAGAIDELLTGERESVA